MNIIIQFIADNFLFCWLLSGIIGHTLLPTNNVIKNNISIMNGFIRFIQHIIFGMITLVVALIISFIKTLS